MTGSLISPHVVLYVQVWVRARERLQSPGWWQYKVSVAVALGTVVNPTVGVNGVEKISESVSRPLLRTAHFLPSILSEKSKCYYIWSHKLFYQLTNVQRDDQQPSHLCVYSAHAMKTHICFSSLLPVLFSEELTLVRSKELHSSS